MKGNISSIETMGLVDGPGVRLVVFFQGCSLRCIFCHNPETWNSNSKTLITVEDLYEKIMRYKNYFGVNGGVTFSGGEPLLQPEFLTAILKKCKENNIHTAIDTAGYGCGEYESVLEYTDLVIFDIKAIDQEGYKTITGRNIEESIKFLNLCQQKNKDMWLRQVIVPTINDNEDYIMKLKDFIKPLKNIKKIELLPYKTFGNSKYDELNIKYRLKEIPDMDINKLNMLAEILKSDNL